MTTTVATPTHTLPNATTSARASAVAAQAKAKLDRTDAWFEGRGGPNSTIPTHALALEGIAVLYNAVDEVRKGAKHLDAAKFDGTDTWWRPAGYIEDASVLAEHAADLFGSFLPTVVRDTASTPDEDVRNDLDVAANKLAGVAGQLRSLGDAVKFGQEPVQDHADATAELALNRIEAALTSFANGMEFLSREAGGATLRAEPQAT